MPTTSHGSGRTGFGGSGWTGWWLIGTVLAVLAVQCCAAHASNDEVAEALATCQAEDKIAELRARACTLIIAAGELEADLRAEALLNRGIVRQEANDLDGAIADFSAAIELNPEYPALYAHRAGAYEAKEQLDLALADLTTVIRLVPDDADAYASRGDIHARLAEYEKAESDYRAALRRDPGHEDANEGLKRLGLK
ncbi:MAG TPA: tetratricopeptide repeat protein [Hyphomicrobiaceae bacterium]|jgi:tetratricopeptide (TPR) repeat protein|nr:tetratricopeptide repeat protein [Hyphomicrobiaceae bacterium]